MSSFRVSGSEVDSMVRSGARVLFNRFDSKVLRCNNYRGVQSAAAATRHKMTRYLDNLTDHLVEEKARQMEAVTRFYNQEQQIALDAFYNEQTRLKEQHQDEMQRIVEDIRTKTETSLLEIQEICTKKFIDDISEQSLLFPNVDNADECVVCYTNYETTDAVISILRCGHEICDACQLVLRREARCPVCMRENVF